MRFILLKSIFLIQILISLASGAAHSADRLAVFAKPTRIRTLSADQASPINDPETIHPAYYAEMFGKSMFDRPSLSENYVSEQGHFKIHYTVSGADAVPLTSTNPDGVPDWVYDAARSAERVYRILVDTLNFDPPPGDNNTDGPEYDIFLRDWPRDDNYGVTYPENEIQQTNRPYDYSSYIVIDNDFAEEIYYTRGPDALHVTIAHEFFHAVQLGYNWHESNGLPGVSTAAGDRYFLEWCSVWMEERAYPAVDDYFQYLPLFFYSPEESLWSNYYHYSLGMFIRYITDLYGEQILAQIWEKIKDDFAFTALDETLAQYGTGTAALWNEFVRRSYFTGSRYDEIQALSPDARDFPLLQFPSNNSANLVDEVDFEITGEPFSTNLIMVAVESNMLIGLKNFAGLDQGFYGSLILNKDSGEDISEPFTFYTDFLIGEAGPGDSLGIFVTNNDVQNDVAYSLTVAQFPDTVSYPSVFLALYPNPLGMYLESDLNFKLQLGRRLSSLECSIINLLGQELLRVKYEAAELQFGPNILHIPYELIAGKNPPSGVYFIVCRVGSKTVSRKFTIIR